MSITVTTEERFESDIEDFFISAKGGYTKGNGTYDPKMGVYPDKLISFIKRTQPREWAAFERQNGVEPVRKFCVAFNNACNMDGVLHVLRNGFKHRGTTFRVCYFKPESSLNEMAQIQYAENEIECYRQWYYSVDTKKSVDMVLTVNGIPVFAFELKNQYTGQNVDNAQAQWMYDRDPREVCFQFNKRILAYFCVDHTEVWMTTKLARKYTHFLPFNQGSNGAGADGGSGNPPNPDGYPTAYLWENVFQKDSMMDIIQKFINLQKGKILIFPRYHQLDVVRKLVADVRANGAGKNYLIQHSAGSGKSNSIAWTAYRLASLFDKNNKPVFSSVIVVTDRMVLDAQLQETISGFDHKLGAIETIGEDKNSQDLKMAINDGVRIIVTTLQKFPVIYTEVDKANGRCFAVIVDEAHSSQTGSSALKLKTALADTEEALAVLNDIALNHKSPELGKPNVTPQEDKEISLVESIENNAINSVRSVALQAIANLIWDDNKIADKFMEPIKGAIEDPNPVMRYASQFVLWPIYNINRQWASEQIISLYENDIRMAGFIDGKEMLLRLYVDDRKKIIKIVKKMFLSKDKRLIKISGYIIAELYMLYDEYKKLIVGKYKFSKEQKEAILEMLIVYVGVEKYREKAKIALIHNIDDSFNIEFPWTKLFYDKLVDLDKDEEFINTIFSSIIGGRVLGAFINFLKESQSELRCCKNIVLQICFNLIELGENSNKILWIHQDEISKLVISLYDAYSDNLEDDDGIAMKCLDIWDAMYQKQIGMARELTKSMMDI